MSPNQAPAFVVVALLLFASATPLAHAQLNGITVNGKLCCTSTGNCPAGATGIPGVLVQMNCTSPFAGGSITVGQGVTNVNGIYNISVPNVIASIGLIPSIIGSGLPCVVFVNLPLNHTVCPILCSATGILAGIPTLLNIVFSPVLGLIGEFVVLLLINISV